MIHAHAKPSPHAVLGIPESASLTEAEQAWKKLARALHPDRHAPEERESLGAQLAAVNAAWSALRTNTLPTPHKRAGVQHAVFYTARDPLVVSALSDLLSSDSKTVQKHWFSNLMRGKRPRRARPLAVVLCSAVVAEGKHITLLFEAPLPKGRCAILVPTLRWAGGRVNVQAERPLAYDMHTPTAMTGQFSPFSPTEVQEMGFESLSVMFPSRPLDITKTVRLTPPSGLSRLFYRI